MEIKTFLLKGQSLHPISQFYDSLAILPAEQEHSHYIPGIKTGKAFWYTGICTYVRRWLPEMDMERIGSVKLVSKSKNNLPFLV